MKNTEVSKKNMVVVTPSYGPDLSLFAQLHRSVLQNFPVGVRHIVVVPEHDVPAFQTFASPRCLVVPVKDFLPEIFWKIPEANAWVNPRCPIPPVRGWIAQQLVKLAAAERLNEDILVFADSDVCFVRPVDIGTFVRGDVVRFYRLPRAVDAALPRHLQWHRIARKLQGLSLADPPWPDYVSSVVVWDRRLVLAMQRRIEKVTGKSWVHAVGREFQFSEWTLYGVYVDCFGSGADRSFSEETSLCHCYWEPRPLAPGDAETFIRSLPPRDIAVMISAKSRTPLATRDDILGRSRAAAASQRDAALSPSEVPCGG